MRALLAVLALLLAAAGPAPNTARAPHPSTAPTPDPPLYRTCTASENPRVVRCTKWTNGTKEEYRQ